jgi:hypothetical protein
MENGVHTGAGIISTTVSGVVTIDEIKKIADEVFKEAKRRDVTKLTNDYRNASLNVSSADIHDLPKHLLNSVEPTNLKSAFVYSVNTSNKPDYDFFDTLCFNSMLIFKVFTDYDAAYQWLVDDLI